MNKCQVVSIETPRKYQLDGLLFGGESAETGLIFLHGLGSSVFSQQDTLMPITSPRVAALYVSNRGHDIISRIKKRDNSAEKGYVSELAGMAHESFADSVDDIEGCIKFLEARGVKKIILVGHSTGCQKAIFCMNKSKYANAVHGVVLLCPLSDYAYAKKYVAPGVLAKATNHAKKYVRNNQPAKLLPSSIWSELIDAQRFLSLYTPDSQEEIFTYSQPRKQPKLYANVTKPMLAIFAEDDEYADRSAHELEDWFQQNNNSRAYESYIISGSPHNLEGSREKVAAVIEKWLEAA